MIRIVTCDDHGIFLQGLKLILEENRKYKVVKEFQSGKDLLAQLIEIEFDVLLLDVNLADRNGIDLLKQIKSIHPHCRVVMLSMYDDPSIALRALQAGANGYLHKNVNSQQLERAIDTVKQGNYYFLAETNHRIIQKSIGQQKGHESPHDQLSDRELEVLILFGKGLTNSEISERLNLSPKTISTYKQRIQEKLKINSTIQIFEYAKEHKLV